MFWFKDLFYPTKQGLVRVCVPVRTNLSALRIGSKKYGSVLKFTDQCSKIRTWAFKNAKVLFCKDEVLVKDDLAHRTNDMVLNGVGTT